MEQFVRSRLHWGTRETNAHRHDAGRGADCHRGARHRRSRARRSLRPRYADDRQREGGDTGRHASSQPARAAPCRCQQYGATLSGAEFFQWRSSLVRRSGGVLDGGVVGFGAECSGHCELPNRTRRSVGAAREQNRMLTRRSRQGFTLIEMMIATGMSLIVSGALYQLLTTTQRLARAQVEHLTVQATVRDAILVLLNEFRELNVSAASEPERNDVLSATATAVT